jgi:hypothetical protein
MRPGAIDLDDEQAAVRQPEAHVAPPEQRAVRGEHLHLELVRWDTRVDAVQTGQRLEHRLRTLHRLVPPRCGSHRTASAPGKLTRSVQPPGIDHPAVASAVEHGDRRPAIERRNRLRERPLRFGVPEPVPYEVPVPQIHLPDHQVLGASPVPTVQVCHLRGELPRDAVHPGHDERGPADSHRAGTGQELRQPHLPEPDVVVLARCQPVGDRVRPGVADALRHPPQDSPRDEPLPATTVDAVHVALGNREQALLRGGEAQQGLRQVGYGAGHEAS